MAAFLGEMIKALPVAIITGIIAEFVTLLILKSLGKGLVVIHKYKKVLDTNEKIYYITSLSTLRRFYVSKHT